MEPRDLRETHNRRRGRPSEDEDPLSLADFGIIHTIGNEAAQEREGGATEPPVSNEEEGPRSRSSTTRWTNHGAARSLTRSMEPWTTKPLGH